VEFVCGEIHAALKTRGEAAVSEGLDALAKNAPKRARESIRIVVAASPEESRSAAESLNVKPLAPNAAAQSYAIRKHSAGGEVPYAVLAADATGAMYGGLDLAEAVRLGTLVSVTDSDHTPFIANRGIKFNIPLKARTPSYSDAGFWHEFLDELARQRYNVISLWNLHPFPSMVNVPEYPDIALADFMRTTEKFDSSYDLTGKNMVRPSMLPIRK
jgi:hypothetical protein